MYHLFNRERTVLHPQDEDEDSKVIPAHKVLHMWGQTVARRTWIKYFRNWRRATICNRRLRAAIQALHNEKIV
ncbi:unnamed protein product, partial [Amoebophrya sp. A25]|eukprot:GSA25T00023955001.1